MFPRAAHRLVDGREVARPGAVGSVRFPGVLPGSSWLTSQACVCPLRVCLPMKGMVGNAMVVDCQVPEPGIDGSGGEADTARHRAWGGMAGQRASAKHCLAIGDARYVDDLRLVSETRHEEDGLAFLGASALPRFHLESPCVRAAPAQPVVGRDARVEGMAPECAGGKSRSRRESTNEDSWADALSQYKASGSARWHDCWNARLRRRHLSLSAAPDGGRNWRSRSGRAHDFRWQYMAFACHCPGSGW